MATKQAACLACRKSKIRCKRENGAAICDRCVQADAECIVPGDFHIGRQKGVRNKRVGLHKAFHQIEDAIKRSKTDSSARASSDIVDQLQQLLAEAQRGLRSNQSIATSNDSSVAPDRSEATHSSDDQLALDDAENPLQLLARASDLRLGNPQTPDNLQKPFGTHLGSDEQEQSDGFFRPMTANPDVGPHLDPVDLGLVTTEEAEMLMTFFHERLAHTRWGLDPAIHTLSFVRSRSSFLFTSLLAASSLFLDFAAALSKRLLVHRKFLADQVIARRYRSVEIVLAFMVNIPWMHPGSHAGDDDTGLYISTALSIALDLSLNKIIVPSQSISRDLLNRTPKAECLEAKKALAMDGFEDVGIQSEWGERLLRTRERVWIALFVLERGVCLARGRSYCLPVTPLIKYCDLWHVGTATDMQDGPLISMAVLRRDLDGLFSAIRSRCDTCRATDAGSKVAHDIETTIESFFSKWLTTWTSAIGEGEQKTLPPYVEILVTHTRLSTYSGVINHPTAPSEVKRLFRASALSSALNVMRAAIQGEARLKSMPNNTVTMICFAACVALTLGAPSSGGNHSLAPSVRNLIEETATVLERVGSTPSHRNGASVIYGNYLRELVKQAPDISIVHQATSSHHVSQALPSSGSLFAPATDLLQSPSHQEYPMTTSWEDPFQFSAMSGNEVIETVMNIGDFDSSLWDLPMQEANSFLWMDWINPLDSGLQL
ncbi:hypothetical protein K458DRAFT_409519 [Lentithecium fluviatile CBS 122367]|uniref:Zn(2)-C6 fungal-type domain-containing protein n=1 Tax=Lentithecium fluviatile CBS 122367 TaxID=1168545 RepID=A0A6G1IHT0_9PLEO|nr:hypothetical protein K458DRAFT_409519 [Lentithecium fluviatile CBS 122367]